MALRGIPLKTGIFLKITGKGKVRDGNLFCENRLERERDGNRYGGNGKGMKNWSTLASKYCVHK